MNPGVGWGDNITHSYTEQKREAEREGENEREPANIVPLGIRC